MRNHHLHEDDVGLGVRRELESVIARLDDAGSSPRGARLDRARGVLACEGGREEEPSKEGEGGYPAPVGDNAGWTMVWLMLHTNS
jgi:hypothetical protein